MTSPLNRRHFLAHSAMTTGGLLLPSFWTPGIFADELVKTASMAEGPFYPDKLPLDTDNDLLIINDSITPAVGAITHLSGKVLTSTGAPVRNAFVEIWQVDNHGVYLHSGSNNSDNRDSNFQGYGRFLTDSTGRYYFRTIKPVPYPGRTPHIHVAISQNGKRVLTTQMLIYGEKQNATDGLFRRIHDPIQREALQVEFSPIKDSKLGELSANFDIVLGVTPDEEEIDSLRGGISKPTRR